MLASFWSEQKRIDYILLHHGGRCASCRRSLILMLRFTAAQATPNTISEKAITALIGTTGQSYYDQEIKATIREQRGLDKGPVQQLTLLPLSLALAKKGFK